MKSFLRTIAAIAVVALFASAAVAGNLVNVAGASGIALSGYDPWPSSQTGSRRTGIPA